ncbi:hypothetical protein KOW79_021155 [Hemibagrus wyckioides]|uniref:arylamine N-acetyltransferase n=1 Tax=Hemibagrus wyckioides TaxID=337641 RepID=A0A9D3S8Y5_9TELE|nr:hypothetical protein KOW79_021155 [Hemibagrus wyckioides]
MSIPFENFSIHCGEWNTVDLQIIYEKIVRNRRGGWCCENNLLFSWVLREMGYKYTTLGSREFRTILNDFSPVDSHLINLVEIEGKPYIADVSFGSSYQIWYPLEMISGKDQEQLPGIFRLMNDGDTWRLEKTGRKPLVQNEAFANSVLVDKRLTKPIFSFVLTPRGIDHFLTTSEYLQTSPESLFTQKSICSLQTPTGFRALIGWTYSEVTFNPEENTDIFEMRDVADSEIETILKEKFNIVLTNKLMPGKIKVRPPGIFRLLNDSDTWTLEKTGRKPLAQNEAFASSVLFNKRPVKPIFSFVLTPRGIDHFLTTSEYLQTSPESLFTQKSICSLQTPTGFRALIGWTYSEVTFNPEENTDIFEMRNVADNLTRICKKNSQGLHVKVFLKERNGSAGILQEDRVQRGV